MKTKVIEGSVASKNRDKQMHFIVRVRGSLRHTVFIIGFIKVGLRSAGSCDVRFQGKPDLRRSLSWVKSIKRIQGNLRISIQTAA